MKLLYVEVREIIKYVQPQNIMMKWTGIKLHSHINKHV